MGSGESTTRKVSFGVDDEDRVRILRGVKLSEDVLQRMKGVANIAPERKPSTNSNIQKDTGASTPRPQQNPLNQAQPKTQSSTNKPTSYAKEEQKRFERQQTKLKEDLARASQKESEAAKEEMIKAMSRERHNKRQEAEKAKQLAQKLQKKDSQLKALDAFYKEQLALLEKRNLERYGQSKEQFHQAASEAEVNVRYRSTEPVCVGVQTQILSCYRANRDQTLKCSDLAKEYMKCIDAAKKELKSPFFSPREFPQLFFTVFEIHP
ncbi:MICOS complex subunit mic25a isoform X2 [Notolabrus celidotus]|uniref:MICOS complex subunit mic25a isoform X2 n=1 Tax=Notolabrus celidotus TaxID=1203425 RepID=UPI00149003E9|nr:MICOS complex subunit mic25a isoform X2 [Notolabrus celidotus]